MIDAQEAGALAPLVRTQDVLAATFHAGDGYCAPEAVVLGYATAGRGLGVRIVTGVEVTGITTRPVPDGPDRITEVVTTAGPVGTENVICCAGPWSAAVGAMVGVDLPVTPVRQQILVTGALPGPIAARTPASMPMTVDLASTFYLHPEGPGILLGMSYPGQEPGFHLGLSDDWLPDLVRSIGLRAPDLLDVGIAHGWSGLYEDTPDHNALIGQSGRVSRFLYATGFSGHGFLQSPAVGEVVRDLYLGQQPFVDVGPLSAERFAAGLPRPEVTII
jgi:sarcosine oxidase subunit beta